MRKIKIVFSLIVIVVIIFTNFEYKNNHNNKVIKNESSLHFLDNKLPLDEKKNTNENIEEQSSLTKDNQICQSYYQLFKSKGLSDILEIIKRENNITEIKSSFKNIDIKFEDINGELKVLTFTYETNSSGSTVRSATLVKFDSEGYPTPKRLPPELDKNASQYFKLNFPNAEVKKIQKEMYLDFNEISLDFTLVDNKVTSLKFQTKDTILNCENQEKNCTCSNK